MNLEGFQVFQTTETMINCGKYADCRTIQKVLVMTAWQVHI